MIYNYLQIKETKDKRKGIFTSINIDANSPILEFNGEIHNQETMPNPDHPAWLQITNSFFIGPSGGKDDYINHSCNPNCYVSAVGKRAILYSMYYIMAGSELTFDYSTTSTDTLNTWQMDCYCKSYNCRKKISGYQYLDDKTKKNYLDKGAVPLFITNPIFKLF